jgi:hypothetical protein
MWALLVNADTINTIESASDYPYIVAQTLPYLGNKSLSCNCVLFAKDYLGITETLGVAKYIKPTSDVPSIGSIVITNEGPLGHVGVVLDIFDDEIWIVEANYEKCNITYRSLNTNDKVIKGYR